MKVFRTYKYRIYPNKSQKEQMQEIFNACCFVYNKTLEDLQGKLVVKAHLPKPSITEYINRYPELAKFSKSALAHAQFALMGVIEYDKTTCSYVFPRQRNPENYKQSFTVSCFMDHAVIHGDRLTIANIKGIKMVFSRPLPEHCVIKEVTISRNSSGRYYASFMLETMITVKPKKIDINSSVGLDYSSPMFYIDNDGNTPSIPKSYRENEAKIASAHKKLSRMEKGSKNYEKQRIKLAKIYEHSANIRRYYNHCESKRLAETYDIVCIENLNYKGIAESKHFGKTTYDNGYEQFAGYLEYKLQERGGILSRVDRWYPSTKTCHDCGYVIPQLPLSERSWICPRCGTYHDRDINAARNIRRKGVKQLIQKYSKKNNRD